MTPTPHHDDPRRVGIPRVVDVGLRPVTLLGHPMAMPPTEKIVTATACGADAQAGPVGG
jgi:hypothetical protein